MSQSGLDPDTLCSYYALQLVKRHEGFRSRPYPDTASTWAIGYGTNFFTRGINESEAAALALDDVHQRQDSLMKLPWFAALSPARKSALVDVAYATGLEGFLKFNGVIVALCKSDYDAAATALLASKFALMNTERARMDAEILRTGNFPRSATV